jgi:glycine betaine/proline transport system permease protein
VAVAAERVAPVPAHTGRPWWRNRFVLAGVTVAAMVIVFQTWRNGYLWPAALEWKSLSTDLNNFQTWLSDQQGSPNPSVIFTILNGISSGLGDFVSAIASLCHDLTWAGTFVVGVVVALRFGGLRAGLWVAGAFVSFAAMGLWDPAVQTFALVFAAVTLSLAVGIPVGIVAGRSDRFLRVVTPVLDAMQIVPAFAYLMPIVILLSVGPGAAVVTTMIYSVPVAVRITALGIRGVPANTVEAAQALGSTRAQVLTKVQIPLARKMLLLAVNQAILFALSMVVIAALINTNGGLGGLVTNGLNTNPALAVLAGFAIVIMAISIDRSTEAMAERTDPTRVHLTEALRRRLRLATVAGAGAIGASVGIAYALNAGSVYVNAGNAPTWLQQQIQSALNYVEDPSTFFFTITSWIGNHLVQYGLQPLENFFQETPAPVMLAGLTLIAFLLSGLRPAVVTFAMLAAIGVIGEWGSAMDTASQVVVALVLTMLVAFPIGVWVAESERAAAVTRPVLDILQTLPQLVYLIPFIYLMPVSIVPGIIAAVLYAAPVVIRLVSAGIREVPANTVEAASAFGATRGQVLLKVKIPLARDAIMLGVNQGIIMVLAVVVIGGLVGSGGLGYEVAYGLQQGQFGPGVVASLAILALGIALDRVTRGNRRPRLEGNR